MSVLSQSPFVSCVKKIRHWCGVYLLRALTLNLLVAGGVATAEVPSVLVVSGEGAIHQQIGAALQKELETIIVGDVITHGLDVPAGNKAIGTVLASDGLVITVGTRAASFMAENYPNARVLSVLVTASSFVKATKILGTDEHRYFGLLIDQPLERKIALVRRLLPRSSKLSISGLEKNAASNLQASNQICGFEVQSVRIEESDNPIRLLDPYFSSSDAFIPLPQPGSADRNHAKWILYLASRHRKPVIGFSSRYVEAGALAAIFASPQDIVAEAIEIVRRWEASSIPQVAWSRPGNRFSVKTNPQVARFLRIQIPNERELSPDSLREVIESTCGNKGGDR